MLLKNWVIQLPRKKESMSYSVQFTREAKKELAKLPPKIQNKVLRLTFDLAINPIYGLKLRGELNGLYKVKFPPYRLLYIPNHDQQVVTIVRIRHRQNAYK